MPALPVTTRRQFVKATLSAAATLAVGSDLSSTSAATPPGLRIRDLIDTNVTLGRWPFRRLPLDETTALLAKLRQNGVKQAWASGFDGLFHEDLAAANARLALECRQHGRGVLVPFGTVNPRLPGWEEDFRRCVEEHKMPGLRLHPNYHGYKLDDPGFAKLLLSASERRLIVQIALSMVDERMQHPLARVPHVDASPLAEWVQKFPRLPVVLLNWQRAVNRNLLSKLVAAGEIFVDIATVEGVGGVANLLGQIPAQRVLFGSHAPLFYFESASLKLKESALDQEPTRKVCFENARQILPSRKAE
jgi:predicted TIM-barrel fold metal-dependent hydrolase